MKTLTCLVLGMALVACGGKSTPPDAGAGDTGAMPIDGGAHDAGPHDAGHIDAGAHDAGHIDAGTFDAGAGAADAGDTDAGAFDAGSPDAGMTCGPCTTPPANACADAMVLTLYSAAGTCGAGLCAYPSQVVPCAHGCASGLCHGGGWTTLKSNTDQPLFSMWGASATDVWAAGYNGTLVHYDGTKWEVRSSGITDQIVSIHGTASNDIFALSGNVLLHYDGTKWTTETDQLSQESTWGVVYADGPDDCFVYGLHDRMANQTTLLHVSGGQVSTVATAPWDADLFSHAVQWGLQVFSPTNIVFSDGRVRAFDGMNASYLGAATVGWNLWAASPDNVFAAGDTFVQLWSDSMWSLLNTGVGGSVTGVSGTSASRVYASVPTYIYPWQGYVLSWDGQGWTEESIPSGITSLMSVWAAPTGEVFAGAEDGTIIMGP